MHKTRLFALALLACAGCVPDLEVPAGAEISCASDLDCPNDFRCAQTIGRCVAANASDTTAPSATGLAFDRTLLARGAVATLSFAVNEALFSEPQVTLALPTGEVPLTAVSHDESGHWVFAYTAQGNESEAEAGVPVEVSLVDSVGNQGARIQAGKLRFDFHPPEVALVQGPARAAFAQGDTAAISFQVSEPLAGTPLVTLGDGSVLVASALSGASTFLYEYAVAGSEIEGVEQPISVVVQDLAGNATVVDRVAVLRFDFTPPSIAGTPIIPLLAARAHQQVTVAFSADEALGALPGFTVGGIAGVSRPDETTGGYVASFDVPDNQPNGPNALRLTLVDLAGNARELLLATPVAIDTIAPTVTAKSIPTTPFRDSTVSPEVVSFHFELSEPLLEGPFVVLSADTFQISEDQVACTPVALGYDCAFTMPVKPDPTSAGALSVKGSDAVGNPFVATLGTLAFDFKPPEVRGVSLDLLPDPGNPQRSVTAVKNGTTVRARFTVSEEVGAVPQVWATNGATRLDLAITEGTSGDTLFTAQLIATATTPSGSWQLFARAADVAGNASADTLLGAFTVDNQAPVAAWMSSLRYRRFPWGDQRGPTPRFEVEGQGGAVEAFATVAVTDVGGNALTQTRANASGAFGPVRLLADYPYVYLKQIDSAGNESATELIQNVEWTANLGGKVAGSRGSNPHLAGARAVLIGSLFQEELELPTGGATVAIADDAGPLQTAPDAGYFRRLHGEQPAPVFDAAMAYDGARGRVVLFGGIIYKVGTVDQLWEYDGSKWQQRFPSDPEGDGNPEARSGHAMVYDSRRGRVVLFGGTSRSGVLGDFWEFDGRSWKNVVYGKDQARPSARSGAAMAFDSNRSVIVLEGGRDESGNLLSDTWEFDTLTEQWTFVEKAELQRENHTLTYDPIRQEMILFGGFDGSGLQNDTWVWADGQWMKHDQVGPPPSLTPRQGHTAVFDEGLGQILLFGGDATRDETFAWDGTQWVERGPKLRPRGRIDAAMTFDAARGEVVLFGGLTEFGDALGDTWKWQWKGEKSEERWTDASATSVVPAPRQGAAMAYNSFLDSLVLVGGQGQITPSFSDTWSFDGYRWTELTGSAGTPGPLRDSALSEEVVSKACGTANVLFGGRNSAGADVGRTWELCVQGGYLTWIDVTPSGSPSPRSLHAMARVPGTQQVLLFGGLSGWAELGDTWVYEAGGWKQMTGPAPFARSEAALAPAPGDALVLFGGSSGGGVLADTWTWSGGGWRSEVPAHSPPARAGATLVFDPLRGRTLLFGGRDGDGNRFGDLWEWDGGDWRQVRVFDPYGETRPSGLAGTAGAFDPAIERVVFFGGRRLESDAQSLSDETWVWDSGARARAGHVFFADLQSARVSFTQMTSAWVRVRAGATTTNPLTKDPQDGVSVLLWDQNQWRPRTELVGQAGSAQPDWLEFEVPQKELQRTLFGPSMYLPIAIVPATQNGSGATVNLDYVEIRLSYTATEVAP